MVHINLECSWLIYLLYRFFFTLNFEGLCMTYVQQSKAMKGYDCGRLMKDVRVWTISVMRLINVRSFNRIHIYTALWYRIALNEKKLLIRKLWLMNKKMVIVSFNSPKLCENQCNGTMLRCWIHLPYIN